MPEAPWMLSPDAVCRQLRTDLHRGLSAGEAAQRLEETGPNELPQKSGISPLAIFLGQFNSLIVWVLIGAAVIAGLLGEWIDSGAIGVIILLNALLGFVQEYRAEKSLAALKKLSTPSCRVLRDGRPEVLPSARLVPGDIVYLEAGDRIPADGRVLHSVQLHTQEASLTGESVPVRKDVAPIPQDNPSIGDRKNMVFMGTAVTTGKGEAVVTATGLSTELGRIAAMLEEAEEEPTPLQLRLKKIGKALVFIFLAVVAMVFFVGILRGHTWVEMILTALSLAVAAIPEGLPAVVTISLALGVQRMARRNALIRRLPSVETLGCATVICSDKTGTLTKNEMTVRRIWTMEGPVEVTGAGYAPQGEFRREGRKLDPKSSGLLTETLRLAVLCNNASLSQKEDQWSVVGDPTEGALLTAAAKAGLQKEALENEYALVEEIPFDSERKRMSMIRRWHGKTRLCIKGAPDLILERCESFLMGDREEKLSEAERRKINEANTELARQAFRVLAVAQRNFSGTEKTADEDVEKHLTFVGLIAMIDPPRQEVKDAIRTCEQAGIRAVMITGDHKETALAIGRELGMAGQAAGEALSGAELDRIPQDQFNQKVRDIAVYARVSAEHKMRVIRAWKQTGAVVAMTGDGVNDAPAVKEADIGIAMGITGTDVTKEASDMVITDDNFASIVSAVEEGRGIYDNILKFVNYLLSSNIAEILVLFIGMLVGWRDPTGQVVVPLSAVQLLWMNLVTDGLPAVALGLDPITPNVMKRPPLDPKAPIFSLSFSLKIGLISLLITAGALTAYGIGIRDGAALCQTMTLTTLVTMQLVRVEMIRSAYKLSLLSNRWLILALLTSIGLQVAIIYTPFFQNVFGLVPLTLFHWGMIALISAVLWVAGTLLDKLVARFIPEYHSHR